MRKGDKRIINGVQVEKVGWGRYRVAFSEDEVALLHKPDLIGIVLSGKGDIPNALLNQVLEQIDGKPRSESQDSLTTSDLPALGGLIDQIVKAAWIGAEGGDEVTPDDLSTDQRMWIFQWAMPSREVGALKTFPEQPSSGVESVPDGDEVRATPVGDAEGAE